MPAWREWRLLKQTSPSFRGGVAEPGIHGVRRLGTNSTPWIPAWPFLETSSRCARLAFAGMTMLRYWGSSLRYGLNPMDPRLAVPRNFVSLRETRFRGDDGVFFRYRQIIRHSRVGKLFVTPESASYSSFRSGVAEPGIHGVRRSGTNSTPWIPAFAGMTAVRCMGFVAEVRT